jgi:hypothetical protein
LYIEKAQLIKHHICIQLLFRNTQITKLEIMSLVTDIYLRDDSTNLKNLDQVSAPSNIRKIRKNKYRPMFISNGRVYHYNVVDMEWWLWH